MPQTGGMVERLDGRIASEVLGINFYSHRALDQLLRGFNVAYKRPAPTCAQRPHS